MSNFYTNEVPSVIIALTHLEPGHSRSWVNGPTLAVRRKVGRRDVLNGFLDIFPIKQEPRIKIQGDQGRILYQPLFTTFLASHTYERASYQPRLSGLSHT